MSDIQEELQQTTSKTPLYKQPFAIFLLLFFCTLSIFRINFSIVKVNGNSMYPTYHDNQFLIGEYHFNINRYDVVVINTPDKYLIKRVIGLPNDSVEYKDNILYINDKEVDDVGTGITNDFKIELSNNEYFCLGDNREHSKDSRYYGAFLKDDIIAKVR